MNWGVFLDPEHRFGLICAARIFAVGLVIGWLIGETLP
jgi:uncharacterized membrane protein YciS (DUF1049 family)